MKNPRILTTLIVLFLSSVAHAQLSQPLRYECEHKSGAFNYTVLSMNENGMALLHQIDKYEGSDNFWEVVLLDTTLQKTWEYEFALNNQLNLIGYDYIEGEVYFLFRKGTGDHGPLHLIQVRTTDRLMSSFDIETKLEFKLAYFNIIGNSAVLGGYVSRQPAVFLHELKTGRSKVVPGFFMKNTELLDVRANHNGTFNTLVMDRSLAEKKQLIVKTLDETGALIMDDAIEVDHDKTMLTGVTSTLLRDELLVTGTWGLPNGKIAMGVYTVLVDPFNKQTIQYYDFSEFGHFMDYLSPKKASRIKAKTARRKKKGKLPSWGVFVNTARLVECQDGFVLLSEVYSPMSTSNSYFNQSYNNPYYNPAYSGYGYGSYNPYGFNSYNPRYSPYGYGNSPHRSDVNIKFSSVAIFNAEGRLQEDTGMKVNYIRLSALDQLSDFIISPEKITQVFRNETNLIASTSPRAADPLITRETVPVRLNHPDDVLRSEQNDEGSLRHWYSNYLFVWGYQAVRENDGSGNRNVFYVNKLKVD